MNTGRVWWGLLLLALGGILLAAQLDALDAGDTIARWWPVVIVVAGLLRLLERPRDVVGATVLTVLGLVLLGWRHELFDLSVILPVLLIAAGLWVLLRRGSRRSPARVGDNSVEVVAVFAAREVRVTSAPFEGGRVVAVLGGADVDLRDAVLPSTGAVLEVVAVLGGVKLNLPAGWDIRVTGPAMLGAIEEKTLPPAHDGAPTLDVKATAVLGGVELQTDPRTQAATSPPG